MILFMLAHAKAEGRRCDAERHQYKLPMRTSMILPSGHPPPRAKSSVRAPVVKVDLQHSCCVSSSQAGGRRAGDTGVLAVLFQKVGEEAKVTAEHGRPRQERLAAG